MANKFNWDKVKIQKKLYEDKIKYPSVKRKHKIHRRKAIDNVRLCYDKIVVFADLNESLISFLKTNKTTFQWKISKTRNHGLKKNEPWTKVRFEIENNKFFVKHKNNITQISLPWKTVKQLDQLLKEKEHNKVVIISFSAKKKRFYLVFPFYFNDKLWSKQNWESMSLSEKLNITRKQRGESDRPIATGRTLQATPSARRRTRRSTPNKPVELTERAIRRKKMREDRRKSADRIAHKIQKLYGDKQDPAQQRKNHGAHVKTIRY